MSILLFGPISFAQAIAKELRVYAYDPLQAVAEMGKYNDEIGDYVRYNFDLAKLRRLVRYYSRQHLQDKRCVVAMPGNVLLLYSSFLSDQCQHRPAL